MVPCLSMSSAAHAHAGSDSCAPCDADPLCWACQLNALSLDIPDEMPVHDMQTDFPWAYENTAESADMLSRVLEVRTRAVPYLSCEALSAVQLTCVPFASARCREPHAVQAMNSM